MIAKKNFPFFNNNPQLHYLDNAATTQKPEGVINAIADYYRLYNAPLHRGIYAHAEQATVQYEAVRSQVAELLHAQTHEIVFTRGATEGINVVAQAWAADHIAGDDEIIITELNHHANIVPWLMLARQKHCKLTTIPVDQYGVLNEQQLLDALTTKTKLVAITHTSNVTSQTVDVRRLVDAAKKVGAHVLVDAAQSIPHQDSNVHELGCDFLVFSGHKMMGPTGVGVLYIHERMHKELKPYQLGGGMVHYIDNNHATWRAMPHMLEAGTQSASAVIGLGAALVYRKTIDLVAMQRHEAQLCAMLIEYLEQIPAVHILGPYFAKASKDRPAQKEITRSSHMVSFTVDGMHSHDVAAYLDQYGIAVRAGNHCAQPFHARLNIPGSVRVSFYGYNTVDDVYALIAALQKLF